MEDYVNCSVALYISVLLFITSEPNQVARLVEMSKMNQLGPADGFKSVDCIRRIEIGKRNTSSLLSYSRLLAGSVLLIQVEYFEGYDWLILTVASVKTFQPI